MRCHRFLFTLLLFLLLAFGLGGCGDSNVFSSLADNDSAQAQFDQGLAAINAGDYAAAITILEVLNLEFPADPEIRRYLASAYAGRAGFDALTLIEILSEDDDGGEDIEMFSTIGELFGSDLDGNVPALDAKLADIGTALDLLAPAGLSDADSSFQAGLYGAVSSVLLVNDILEGASLASIETMDPEEIASRVDNNFGQPVSATDPTLKGEALVQSLALVAKAAFDLTAAIEPGSGESNDLADEMDQLLAGIGYTDDDAVDQTELASYLQGL